MLLNRVTSSDVILVGGKASATAVLVDGESLGVVGLRVKSRARDVYWAKVMWADLSSKEAILEAITKTDAPMSRRSMMRKQLRALHASKQQLLF